MSFEDVMMKRLAKCHAEACDEIEEYLEYLKAGVPLSDAVSYTIKELPASKTRDLRRWLEDWEAWEEWQALRKDGWRAQRLGKFVYVQSLRNTLAPAARGYLRESKYGAIVAAAVGVRHAVRYDDSIVKIDRDASRWRITTPSRYIVRFLISTDV